MKKLFINSIKALTFIILLFSISNLNAERKIRFAPLAIDGFTLNVQNMVQTANNKFEFDAYLLDTDPSLSFELASMQFGFLINSSIYTGGTLTVTIDNTNSGLNSLQKFTAIPNATTTIGTQTVIKLVSGILTTGQGTIISSVAPGTLITHFIVKSSVPFPANAMPNLTFTTSATMNPSYATRVAEFITNLSTQLDVNIGTTNAIVVGNPILNTPPTSYAVTGSGSYCQGTGGLAVGLAGSEVGVTYTLYNGTIALVPTVAGTGSAITFGNQLAGTYTVSGTNFGGTQVMTGNAVITENPSLVAGVSIVSDQNNVCAGTAVTLSATPTNGGAAPSYQWYNKTTAVGTNSSTYIYSPANGDLISVVMTSNATPCLNGSPVTSNVVTMTVNPPLNAGVSIVSDQNNVCTGTTVTLTATPTNGGAAPSYQWYNKTTAVGTNSPTYFYTPANGDLISVVMTSNATPCLSGSPVTSNVVTMTVNALTPANVSVLADANNVCDGTTVVFTATPIGGGAAPVYHWYNKTTAVGTNSSTYSYIPANGDVITVVMTSNSPCASGSPVTSSPVMMLVNPVFVASVSISASFNPVNTGTPVTFTAIPVGGGTAPVYQWYNNGTPVGSNLNTFTYSPNNGDIISLIMTSNATCVSGSPASSNQISMNVSVGTSIDQTKMSIDIYSRNKNIYVNCSQKAKQIYIYNTLGSMVMMENNVTGLKEFYMNTNPNAYYFVRIVTDNNVYTQKVLLK